MEYLEIALHSRLKDLGWSEENIQISRPKKVENGDWASNIALILARKLQRPPLEIANELVESLELDSAIIEKFEVVPPGFINFFQNPEFLTNQIRNILDLDTHYGRNKIGEGQTAQVEFVSANPTGPLTVGHGRQTVLGDTLASILEWCGYSVTREYYFNNAGRQMRLLGESLRARYLELKNLPEAIPEGGYQGQYLVSIAQRLRDEQPDLDTETELKVFKDYAETAIFDIIRGSLTRMGVFHDVFYNEQTLYDDGHIDDVLSELKARKLTYEKDGAVWFKTSSLGADQDRVLVKSTGEPTYRLPDIAYHRQKIRREFDLVVDVFGADHIDAYPDVISALKAMNLPADHIHVVIHQFVTLLRQGEIVKMSTRKADFVTLDELLDEVGVDVVRYFYIMRSASSHLNFDLDLAKRQTDENPVFYLQYAHARISSIFRRAAEEDLTWSRDADLALITEPESLALINATLQLPAVIQRCHDNLEIHQLPTYLYELATALHKFYTEYKVVDIANPPLSVTRLTLLKAVQTTLRNGLQILGIKAPDRM